MSILKEAADIVEARRREYDSPYVNMKRTANLVNVVIGRKLKEPLLPSDIARIMQCVKMAREVYHPKYDNRLDHAGYIDVENECLKAEEMNDGLKANRKEAEWELKAEKAHSVKSFKRAKEFSLCPGVDQAPLHDGRPLNGEED